MKYINKVIIAIAAVLVLSCDTELDLLDNPNAVTPEKAGVDFVWNNIQLDFENFYASAYALTAEPARMVVAVGGFTYNDWASPASYDGIWFWAYANLLPDIDALVAQAGDPGNGLDIHAGAAMILKSYVLTTLVDIFGDVPYTEALDGTNTISPVGDDDAAVYAAAETLLDDAIARLNTGGSTSATPAVDIFYDGDEAKWITLANTLKLRIYNNTRLVDGSAGTKIAALVAAGDIIDSPSEDFEFQFGVNRLNPVSRHPFYNLYYESNDGFPMMSNYYMWLLYSEKRDAIDGTGTPLTPQDPRLRFYFYRQENDMVGQSVNVWSCLLSDLPSLLDPSFPVPAHYTAVDPDMPYCLVSLDGYFGRDHLNGSGIPPDGPVRTAYGLYPGGGEFDYDGFDFQQEQGTTGALGRGVWPIVHSSFVYFMRAEAALTAGTGEVPRDMLQFAIDASIDKVRSFESLIDGNLEIGEDLAGNPLTISDIYLDNLDQDQTDYMANVMAMYDAPLPGQDQLDIIVKEYMIAAFGNSLEVYNSLRRTNRPFNIAPAVNTGQGTYLWSAWYPADHVNRNENADQKPNVNQKVFWDTTPMDGVR